MWFSFKTARQVYTSNVADMIGEQCVYRLIAWMKTDFAVWSVQHNMPESASGGGKCWDNRPAQQVVDQRHHYELQARLKQQTVVEKIITFLTRQQDEAKDSSSCSMLLYVRFQHFLDLLCQRTVSVPGGIQSRAPHWLQWSWVRHNCSPK